MKKITAVFLLLALSQIIYADFNWKAYKTERFTLFYRPGTEQKALRLLESMEKNAPMAEKLTGNTVPNIPVLLEEFGRVNPYGGSANPVYYKISLANNSYEDANGLANVAVHEFVHMLHLTNSSGIPGLITLIAGNIAAPNLLSPGWVTEGITTLSEDKLSPYTGRLNTGYFDAYMAACVADGRFPDILKATYAPNEAPSYMGWYLFGGEFFSYLNDTYGEEKFAQFFNSFGASPASYLSPLIPFAGIDRTFDEIFGKVTTQLWDDWETEQTAKYMDYEIEGTQVTNHGWYSFTPVVYGNKLYYRKSVNEKKGAFKVKAYNEIVEVDIENGMSKTLISTTSSFNVPPYFNGDYIYYGVAQIAPGFGNISQDTFGGDTVIFRKNLVTGKEEEIVKGDIRAFYVDNNVSISIIYAEENNDTPGCRIKKHILSSGAEELLFDTQYNVHSIDGHDGIIYFSGGKENENPDIIAINTGTGEFTKITDTPFQERNVRLYGDKLFFNANYGPFNCIYSYDLKDKKFYRLTRNGTAEAPAYSEKTGEIFYSALNSYGFDIYRKPAVFDKFVLPAEKYTEPYFSGLNVKDVKEAGIGDSFALLIPKIRVPLLYFDSNGSAATGLLLSAEDALGNLSYMAEGIYDWQEQKLGYSINISSKFLAPMNFYYVLSDYDGPEINTGIGYPLYTSLLPGFTSLQAGLSYRLFDYFYRDEFRPYIFAGFSFPNTDIGFTLSAALEPDNEYDALLRTGIYPSLNIRQDLFDGMLSVSADYVYDPDNNADTFAVLRGYSSDMKGNFGTKVSAEYTCVLFEIRKGLWNPNFYLEDAAVTLFADSAFSQYETRASFGAELHLEAFTLFSVRLDIKFMGAYSIDEAVTVGFGISVPGL